VARAVTSPHLLINPEMLAPPTGFSHVVVPADGTTVYLGGQTAHDRLGQIVGSTVVEQFDRAAANVVSALAATGGAPEHLVSLHIYVTDLAAYRASLTDLGAAYRKHFGTHYPAIALFGIQGLFDPAALVELVAIAVVPEQQ
jgi:enamine deaminase RidA (YjgF/YER057c/UK114 family)